MIVDMLCPPSPFYANKHYRFIANFDFEAKEEEANFDFELFAV